MFHPWEFVRLCLLLPACLILFTGCGGSSGPPTAAVRGKVLFQGEPVTVGMVNFASPETGRGAGAPINEKGEFQIPEGLALGTYRVAILPPPDPTSAGAPRTEPLPEYPQIPSKYRSEVTSGLTAEVKAGDNNFTFEMQP